MGFKARPSKARQQDALVAAAHDYLDGLAGGDVDDLRDVLQTIDEYLHAIDPVHADIHAELARVADECRGVAPKQPAKPMQRKPVKADEVRRAPAGQKFKTPADRIGGEPPFELTYTYLRQTDRVTGLRAHMRLFFRVTKREQLDEVATIYDELVADYGPFAWLKKSTSQLYGSATASTLARARTRFACPGKDSCYIAVKDAELSVDVAERSLNIEMHPRGAWAYSSNPSMLHVTTAVDAMDRSFRDRFVSLCTRLPNLLCGTAGHFLDVTIRGWDSPVSDRVLDVALAHRGLELAHGFATGSVDANWISGVNWLTALGPAVRGVVGDLSGFEQHRAGDAVVVQASDKPELGVDGLAPPAYARLAALLDRPTILLGLSLPFGDARVNDWHHRLL